MNVLGIKFSHDGAVALISGDKLQFSTEAEKIDNRPRYAEMPLELAESILIDETVDINSIDKVVIDGWKHGKFQDFHVAPYHEFDGGASQCKSSDLFAAYPGPEITLLGRKFVTESYTHVAGHIAGSYAMSGWDGPCNVVVFDGGVNPRLYCNKSGSFELVQPLMPYYGLLYGIMGYYFGPYKQEAIVSGELSYHENKLYGGYSIPGKLMAYIAYGKVNRDLLKELILVESCTFKGLGYEQDGFIEHELCIRAHDFCVKHKISDEDALRTIHEFIILLIVQGLRRYADKSLPLIFTGGSALNIKWNSALRRAGVCREIFVPPVPNDTGSAIGMAVLGAKPKRLEWSVYSGPKVKHSEAIPGWTALACSTIGLARIIAEHPVVVLFDRAEIGPRALGHRSIMANPSDPNNKKLLNRVKGREGWRPVAPICADADAYKYFDPGSVDPYMLFDHVMTDEARIMFPAVMHLDGTARLQTNSANECPFVASLLAEMKKLTGHAIVCNTSANFAGSGFFPDAASAMRWANQYDEVSFVWCDDVLFSKKDEDEA